MRRRAIFLIGSFVCGLGFARSAAAQLPPGTSITAGDPLHRTQSAEACSKDASSSCAAAAAKILPLVMGPSPMQENLRRLTDEIGGRVSRYSADGARDSVGRGSVSRRGRRCAHRKISAAAELERGRYAAGIAGRHEISAAHCESGVVAGHSAGGVETNVVDIGLWHA